jgi:hypothetical protein
MSYDIILFWVVDATTHRDTGKKVDVVCVVQEKGNLEIGCESNC